MGVVPTTFCRICSGICGLQVEVSDGRVTSIRGDAEHPLSQGFTCVKGRRFGDVHARGDRFLTARRGTEELPIATAFSSATGLRVMRMPPVPTELPSGTSSTASSSDTTVICGRTLANQPSVW